MFPEPMLMTAKDGLIHFSNQAALELLQRSSADLDGRDICGLVIEPREKVEQYLLRCSRGAQFHIGLLTFKTSRGDEIPCRCDGARVELAGKTEALLIRQTPRTESAAPFAALDDRIQALNRSRHELENQVRVRTAGLVRAQGALRELSATLMQAQDEGRRRLAHELQDSTGQILTGIQMHLGVILSDPGLALEFRGRLTQRCSTKPGCRWPSEALRNGLKRRPASRSRSRYPPSSCASPRRLRPPSSGLFRSACSMSIVIRKATTPRFAWRSWAINWSWKSGTAVGGFPPIGWAMLRYGGRGWDSEGCGRECG